MVSTISIRKVVVGPLSSNSYLLYDEEAKEGILIDAGGDPEKILKLVDSLRIYVRYVVATHGHFDHVIATKVIKDELGCRFLIHRDDVWLLKESELYAKMYVDEVEIAEPDDFIYEGQRLDFGSHSIVVMHTPGHTQGSVCLLGKGFVMTGDTLFHGAVGRTDLPGGDYEQLARSIVGKLMRLPDDYIVYPGHGGLTSIGSERVNNPYVLRFLRLFEDDL